MDIGFFLLISVSAVTVVFFSHLIYLKLWGEAFEGVFGKKPNEITTEEVFQKLLGWRKLAEESDPRFRRKGHIPRQPYSGWLEIADANWRDYHRARRAAIVCRFL